jgi:hypothetical protein
VNRKIRLIWDFYGDTAPETAKHHLKHLGEFMERSNLPIYNQGTASETELHCLAFITVDEDQVKNLRDTLRPKRAFVEKMD